MLQFDPKQISVKEIHRLLLGGIVPRPIALVSTLSSKNIPNLAPFSFFNVFSANPPIVIFSPSRRGTDGTSKDTLHNLKEIKECVISIVTAGMIEQVNLASSDFAPEIDEFEMAGFTKSKSQIVSPWLISDSPFNMECKVIEIIELGENRGAGNLVLAEVVQFHVDEFLFKDGIINPLLLDPISRLSGDYYGKIDESSLFELPRPLSKNPIGFPGLPKYVFDCDYLTKNEKARLALIEELPSKEDSEKFLSSNKYLFDLSREELISTVKEKLKSNYLMESFHILTLL